MPLPKEAPVFSYRHIHKTTVERCLWCNHPFIRMLVPPVAGDGGRRKYRIVEADTLIEHRCPELVPLEPYRMDWNKLPKGGPVKTLATMTEEQRAEMLELYGRNK